MHLTGPMEWVLVAVAGALAILAASTRGPLGALRALSFRSHRLLDPALALATALSPLAVMHHLGLGGVLVAEAAAAGLGYLALRETGRRPVAVAARPAGRHPGSPAVASLGLPPLPASSAWDADDRPGEEPGAGRPLPGGGRPTPQGRSGGSPERVARAAGRAAGKAREGALEGTDRLLTKGARRLGGMVGRRRQRRHG